MKYKGFTLIELMIVIAVIGILASIAVPAYQDYVTRAHVTEGLSFAASAQTTVAENLMTGNPDLSAGWNHPPATQVIQGIGIAKDTGIITIHYTPLVHRLKINISPLSNGAPLSSSTPVGPISWKCAVDHAKNNRYVPANCRL